MNETHGTDDSGGVSVGANVRVSTDAPRGVWIPPGWTGSVTDLDARSTPGFQGDKQDGEDRLDELDERLDDLQERLYAASRPTGEGRSVCLLYTSPSPRD